MAILLDSVAPLVKNISRGSAPTRLATCYRDQGTRYGEWGGGGEGGGGEGGGVGGGEWEREGICIFRGMGDRAT